MGLFVINYTTFSEVAWLDNWGEDIFIYSCTLTTQTVKTSDLKRISCANANIYEYASPPKYVDTTAALCPKNHFMSGTLLLQCILFLTQNNVIPCLTGNERLHRVRRRFPFPFCTRGPAGWAKMEGCSEDKWVTKCKFSSGSCVYWVTCLRGLHDLRDGKCNTIHQLNQMTCCDLSCP